MFEKIRNTYEEFIEEQKTKLQDKINENNKKLERESKLKLIEHCMEASYNTEVITNMYKVYGFDVIEL